MLLELANADRDTLILNGHAGSHITSDYAKTKATNGYLKALATEGHVTHPEKNLWTPSQQEHTLLSKFLQSIAEVEAYKANPNALVVDGQSLSIPKITALSRNTSVSAAVQLSQDPGVRSRVEASRAVVQSKIEKNQSIYGVSTGYGGSADTRTKDYSGLGQSLLQHQQAGILPVSSIRETINVPLLLTDPFHSTAMPESWVRAAILVRANALVRGHSGVRYEVVERLLDLLRANITPLVPIRGTISASGDLQPLSYVAAVLIGSPSARVFSGVERTLVPAPRAFSSHSITPLVLQPKEHLGLLNGTAFSVSLAALALHDTLHLAVLAQVLTALGTEALLGTRASHARFIHDTCRPHPGQVEVARTVWWLLERSKLAEGGNTTGEEVLEEDEVEGEGNSKLRQDRYPLRTSPQFLGPQLEDILHAVKSIEIECNSTTDNPLIDPVSQHVHHGGNFQAMSVTSALEKTRLALFHVGKLMFAQSTELCNPAMNRGLPPSVAATDPSVNYHAKGLDIASAAYVSELGWLAGPVGVHSQSAEMHNQAVNSLALISARATLQSLEVLGMLMASYLYILCQAVDIRALQAEHEAGMEEIVREEFARYFAHHGGTCQLQKAVMEAITRTLESTCTMDVEKRMEVVAGASTVPILSHFATPACRIASEDPLGQISSFRSAVSERSATLLKDLRVEYLHGKRGRAPASGYLGRTKTLYKYVRIQLGIKMHGLENLGASEGGLEVFQSTIGGDASIIYEAIRDGRMGNIVAGMFQT